MATNDPGGNAKHLDGVAGHWNEEPVQKLELPVPHPIKMSVITIAVPHVQLKGCWKVTLLVGWLSAIPKHWEIGEPETSLPIV